MCWPGDDDPLLGCTRQRNLLLREYGTIVMDTALAYARRLPQPLTRHDKLACISVALKYVEDEPPPYDWLFPGLDDEDLVRAEWAVLEALRFKLRPYCTI